MTTITTTRLFAGAALRLLQDAAGADEEPAEKVYCKMLGGAFGDFVQLSLAVVGIGGLIVKRFQEPHPRPWRIWSLDVGKQCVGSLYAHLLNMLLAMGLTSIAGGGDECAWYFIQYVIDSSLGVILCLILIKVLEWWAARKEAHSWQRLYIAQTGNYGNPAQCRIWYWQTLIWLGIVTASKLGLFFFLIAFRNSFGTWGRVLFKPLQNHPNAELVIVMVLVPGVCNVAQFWILDNLLKSDTTDVPSPPLSPNKAQHFKVSYEPILEGNGGGGGGSGRRRKGGALDWFGTSSNAPYQQPQEQHSWLRPMSWTWGSGAPGGPGQGLRGQVDLPASGGGGGPGGGGGGGGGGGPGAARTYYKPPVPGPNRPVDPSVPAWMSTGVLPPRRPYEDDEEANSTALA